MLSVYIFCLLIFGLFAPHHVQCRPLNAEENNSASGQSGVPVAIIVAIAVTCCMILAVSLCTCCQDVLFNAKPDSSIHGNLQHSNSMEPPGHSIPGTPRFNEDNDRVTIEPLPDINVKRITGANKYGKPMDYNHAVNKGLIVEDWFHGGKMVDFPRNQLEYVKELGNGWFGHVVEGEASKITPNSRKSKVVVKILREDLTSVERAFALFEARKHRDLKHDNIVALLGKSFEKQPYLLIYECCAKGDLKQYLLKNRAQSEELIQNGTLLRMCCNIGSGLLYSHQNDYVINDLACRNFYVTSDLIVKLADCGVAMDLYKEDYVIVGDIGLPIRWTAPESIEANDVGQMITKEITKQANVWTFGVVFWEVLEFAKRPYMNFSNEEVIDRVVRNQNTLLPEPQSPIPLRDKCYQIMKMCWKHPAESRPRMENIMEMLTYIQRNGQNKQQFDDFESKWNNLLPVEKLLPVAALDNDSISPIPADPIVNTPSKRLVYESDNLSPSNLNIIDETTRSPKSQIETQSPDGGKLAKVIDSQPLSTAAPPVPARVSREVELERIDKRNFVLTLNDEELSNLNSSELVQFYEYLSRDEIDDLENRHLKAVAWRKQRDDAERFKKEKFLALSLDEMDDLSNDDLQEYMATLNELEKTNVNAKMTAKKEKDRLFRLGTRQLVAVTKEELLEARESLNDSDYATFEKRVHDAQAEILGRERALAMINSKDPEFIRYQDSDGLCKFLTEDENVGYRKRLEDLHKRVVQFTTATSDAQLAEMPEEKFETNCSLIVDEQDLHNIRRRQSNFLEKQRKRQEILTANDLPLYLLWKNNADWEDRMTLLEEDEFQAVSSRLENVRQIRAGILKNELPPNVGDENQRVEYVSKYLEPNEFASWLDERAKETRRLDSLRQYLLNDGDGLELLREFESNTDEARRLLTDEEFLTVQRRVEEVDKIRAQFLDSSLETVDENQLNSVRSCFTTEEFDRLSDRLRQLSIEREQIRNRVLHADNLALYMLSAEGLDPYLHYLDEREALVVSQRLDDILHMRQTLLNESYNSQTNDEILTEYFTDDEIAHFKRRKVDARAKDEILKARGANLHKLFADNSDKYSTLLSEAEMNDVKKRANDVQVKRDYIMNFPDSELAGFQEDHFASLSEVFTPEEWAALVAKRNASRDAFRATEIPDVLLNESESLQVHILRFENGGLEESTKDLLSDEQFGSVRNNLDESVSTERTRVLDMSPEELSKVDLTDYQKVLNPDELERLTNLQIEFSANEIRDVLLNQLEPLKMHNWCLENGLENSKDYLSDSEFDMVRKNFDKIDADRKRVLNMPAAELSQVDLKEYRNVLTPDEMEHLKNLQIEFDANQIRDVLLNQSEPLNMYNWCFENGLENSKDYLSDSEFELVNKTFESVTFERNRVLSMSPEELGQVDLKEYRKVLNPDEMERLTNLQIEFKANQIRDILMNQSEPLKMHTWCLENGLERSKEYLSDSEFDSMQKNFDKIDADRKRVLNLQASELCEIDLKEYRKILTPDEIERLANLQIEFDANQVRDILLNQSEPLKAHNWCLENGLERSKEYLSDSEFELVKKNFESVAFERNRVLSMSPSELGQIDLKEYRKVLTPDEMESLKNLQIEFAANEIRDILLNQLDPLKMHTWCLENGLERSKDYLSDSEFDIMQKIFENVDAERKRVLNLQTSELCEIDLKEYRKVLHPDEMERLKNLQIEFAANEIRDILLNHSEPLKAHNWCLENGLERSKEYLSDSEFELVKINFESVVLERNRVLSMSPAELGQIDLKEYRKVLNPDEMERLKNLQIEYDANQIRDVLLNLSDPLKMHTWCLENGLERSKDYLSDSEFDIMQKNFENVDAERKRVLNLQASELYEIDLKEYRKVLHPDEMERLKNLQIEFAANEIRDILLNQSEPLKMYNWCAENGLESSKEYLSDDEFVSVENNFRRVDDDRRRILNMSMVELSKLKTSQLNEFKPILLDEEFDSVRMSRQEALEARDGVLSLNDEQVRALTKEQLERYYKYLTKEEVDKLETAHSHVDGEVEQKSVSALRMENDGTDEDFDEAKFNLFKNVADGLTSTPEEDERRKPKLRRAERLSLSSDVVNQQDVAPLATSADLDRYNEARRRALEMSDEALTKMSSTEIEDLYEYLSPTESLSLKERKQRADAELSSTFFQRSVPPPFAASSSVDSRSGAASENATGFIYDEDVMWSEPQPVVHVLKKENDIDGSAEFPFNERNLSVEAHSALFDVPAQMNSPQSDDDWERVNADMPSFRDYLKTTPTLSTLGGDSLDSFSSDEKYSTPLTAAGADDDAVRQQELNDILIDFDNFNATPTSATTPAVKPLSLLTDFDDLFGAGDDDSLKTPTRDNAEGHNLGVPNINVIVPTPKADDSASSPFFDLNNEDQRHGGAGLVDTAAASFSDTASFVTADGDTSVDENHTKTHPLEKH